jgi:hypothetical protein
MIKYKYQISGKTDEEIWVCEACKKGKNDLILTGKWKLIDRSDDSGISCSLCEENRTDTEAGSLL